MSLKSELAEMKDALGALKERIEADDVEAIEKGVQLKADIEAKEVEIAQAEAKAAVLEVIGQKPVEEEKKEMDGIKSMDLSALKSGRGTVSTMIKAAADPETTPQYIADTSRRVADVQPKLGVRDLFSAEQISGNALTYFVMSAIEGEVATVPEGGKKPQIHVPYETKFAALDKIAAYLKETDELLSDAAFLESAIRGRGIYEFNKAVEATLVNDLLNTTGIQADTTALSFDSILAAKQDIIADTGYTPDAMIINPSDWATLLQAKDGNLQYLLGGPGFGSYGNGAYYENPKVWGMTVIESAAVTAGKCIIGAFKAGASVVTKAGEGLRVEVSNSNEDDFIRNMVTVRIEERIALAVRVPAAFCLLGAN